MSLKVNPEQFRRVWDKKRRVKGRRQEQGWQYEVRHLRAEQHNAEEKARLTAKC